MGLPVVYAASSRALAQLEKRAHANGLPPVRQALIRLEMSVDATTLDAVDDLALQTPKWRQDEGCTQGIGTQWLDSKASHCLWVPSLVEPQERDLLVNPAHPGYNAITITAEVMDFKFDPRLF